LNLGVDHTKLHFALQIIHLTQPMLMILNLAMEILGTILMITQNGAFHMIQQQKWLALLIWIEWTLKAKEEEVLCVIQTPFSSMPYQTWSPILSHAQTMKPSWECEKTRNIKWYLSILFWMNENMLGISFHNQHINICFN